MKLSRLLLLLSLCRPDYVIKQVFFALGSFFGVLIAAPVYFDWLNIGLVFLSCVLASSANYVLNEWCDRDSDSYHPTKKFRAVPSRLVRKNEVFALYASLVTFSLILIATVTHDSIQRSIVVLLIINGIVYNKKPIRIKDVAYFDTFIESLNNVFRFALGWVSISHSIPPISLVSLMRLALYIQFAE